ncbi:hypothetical protein AB0F93_14055 [Micromonospora tulbaghiae]|uniref:hypothetical protein n=1 Tax=Micromonospora tulbaghiae TaxID=479978 RepID=UPI00331C5A9B
MRSRVRHAAAQLQQSEPQVTPRERSIPLRTLGFLGISAAVGVSAQYLPEMATPASLALATFLTLDRVNRQIL